MPASPLSIIEDVDSFDYDPNHGYGILIAHDGVTSLGYVHPSMLVYFDRPGFSIKGKNITINADFNTIEKRNLLFEQLGQDLREKPELNLLVAHGWRDELYTVYNPTSTPYLQVERAVSVLLGVVTYGVHINGYVSESNSSDGKLKFWIPRRSATKPTFPSMLDNTVAGGLGFPYGIWETVVKECFEEAGLNEQFVTKNAKSVGVVLYFYKTELEHLQPEMQYVYDLEFENEFSLIPEPQDGEAEDFVLMDVEEVKQRIFNREFKPNCALVVIDFLIRHGYITPENEPYYSELVSRSHRRFPFPTR